MTEFVSRGGVRLAYEAVGAGTPGLMFIPGWCCDRSFFRPQSEHFAARHSVVVMDPRGSGESDCPDPEQMPYSVETMAADVLAVAAAAGLRRPVLVGHSLGAVVALSCASASSDVAAVVMVDPAPICNERSRAYFREVRATVAADADASWRRAFVSRMFLRTDSARRSEILDAMCSGSPAVAAATLAAIGEYDNASALAAVRVPVVSIGSAVPSDRPDDLRAVCPSITIGQTVGSGHFIQHEVPDQVNLMIERFLSVSGLRRDSTSIISVRPLEPGDSEWVRAHLEHAWGSVLVARKGELVDVTAYPGVVASIGEECVGLAVSAVRGDEYEVLAVSTTVEGVGVGRALMQRCFEDAAAAGCRRVWLTTTNDNARAIAFYQRLGMTMCGLRLGAVSKARRLKPAIPSHGQAGVPIEHELDFELLL